MREVNLATLADCTEQEAFDWVASHLKAQGFKQSILAMRSALMQVAAMRLLDAGVLSA